MSAKFLHEVANENREFKKQIGCVTGFFQMFNRHHLLRGRRLNGHNHKRLPSGHALSNSSSIGESHNACSPHIVLEENLSKSSNENQCVSMESSRTSFSSTSCSSFSSQECDKSTHQEPSSMDQTFLERSRRSSPGLKNYDVNSRLICYKPLSDPSHASAQSGHKSLDFQDVVKDSINRETRSLSVKTSTKEEVKNRTLKHIDSPRPMRLSKTVDGSHVIGVHGKSRLPADLNESLRVLVKLKEAPLHFSDASEPPRSSYEAKDTSFFPVSREAPRFSYDGREISRPSLDSRDVSRPASKLRELSRLSLDSREGSLRSSNFDAKPKSILKDLDRGIVNQGASTASNFKQEWGGYKCPTSVVVKLMGLEPMPRLGLASQKPDKLKETYTSKDNDPFNGQRNRNLIAKASQATQGSRKDLPLHSPKSSLKDPFPLLKKSDPVMKPVSNSRLPIETAPWRQQERIGIPQKTTFGCREAHLKQQSESVYSEIEKVSKELEFQQSNKNLRALEQILDAMQAKGLLETKKVEDQHSEVSVTKKLSGQTPTGNHQNFKSTDARSPHNTQPVPMLMKRSNTPRVCESPIVIMKPAKSVIKSCVSASSAIPLEGLSGLRKLQTSDSTNNRTVNDQSPKTSPRVHTYQSLLSTAKKSTNRTKENSIQKTRVQMEQCSSKCQRSPRENNESSVKSSSSLSPRVQQRKLETERRSCPHFPSSTSNNSQRNSVNRQYLESVSPRGRLRWKPARTQQNDDQLSDISSGTRSASHPGNEVSLRSESNISSASEVDKEVTSTDGSAKMNLSCFQQGSQSPSRRSVSCASSVIKQKKSSCSLNEDASAVELATVAREEPSPISVLDASCYQDKIPPSLVSRTSNAFKGDKTQPSDHRGNPMQLLDTSAPKLISKLNHKKLENIENQVQELRQLSLIDYEATAKDYIASLCETQSPDHRYVSEILLASGLLMKDISCGAMGPMPIQLRPSGHPINPDLFLVLEQTKSGSPTKLESVHENTLRRKPEPEKLHRKLLFDVVKELLIQKLELTSPGAQPYLLLQTRKLAGRIPSGQELLRELCSEIEQLKAKSSMSNSYNDDSNLISGEDELRQSERWNGFSTEVPNVVLEIERLIFKGLIDEIVSGEGASGLHKRASR